MSMPYYVSPEQLMADRADFARQGIARGRSVVVLRYRDGIALVAENRSTTLHKVSEIYDRIGFAAVGRYNQFENLRIAGIRWADLRGYSYDRSDVTARGLANAYAQILGSAFASAMEMPFEVELCVAELAATRDDDQIFRLGFDGSVIDEHRFAVIGGSSEAIADRLAQRWKPDLGLDDALSLATEALGIAEPVDPDQLEVAVLDATRESRRKFARVGVA